MFRSAIITIVVAASCISCFGLVPVPGQNGPASASLRGIAENPPLPAGLDAQLGILGFTLGKSTAEDVRLRLGTSPDRRPAGESETDEVCYRIKSCNLILVFEAGVIGGGVRLDGYRILSQDLAPELYRGCPVLNPREKALQTDGGLKLGLMQEEVMALLGQPAGSDGDTMSYEWRVRKPMTEQEARLQATLRAARITDPFWNVRNTIRVSYAKAKVAAIEVHQYVD